MKKIFGISLVVALVMSPMMANAVEVAGDPGAKQSNLTTEQAAAITAGSSPKYALKNANATNDGKAATVEFVKGAYNALIKGINKTQDEVDTLNTDIGTYQNTIDHLLDGKATKTGTVATIKAATTNESIATSSVNINGLTTTSINATASGDVNLSMQVLDDWENDSLAANPIQTTTSFSKLTVNGLSMSAPGTNNTATLTKTDIIGDVDVVKYLASAFDFTTLINVNGSGNGHKSADGTLIYNATGLSRGEWTTTWNAYGTVKGTTMCSSTYGTYAQTGNPSNTEGVNCWCKMTGWTPNGGNETPVASLWVFLNHTYSSASGCAGNCANDCGNLVRKYSDMRSGLFGSVQ